VARSLWSDNVVSPFAWFSMVPGGDERRDVPADGAIVANRALPITESSLSAGHGHSHAQTIARTYDRRRQRVQPPGLAIEGVTSWGPGGSGTSYRITSSATWWRPSGAWVVVPPTCCPDSYPTSDCRIRDRGPVSMFEEDQRRAGRKAGAAENR
jgi:hypothetical protein